MAYDRNAACLYAEHFAEKTCHDGAVVGKDTSDPNKVDFSFVDDPSPIAENDCTHFISCCIGGHKGTFTRHKGGKSKTFPLDKADVLPGGGISLEHDSFGLAYGMFGAPRFARYMIDKKKAVLVTGNLITYPNDTKPQAASLEKSGQFVRGDIIVYATGPDLGAVGHCAIYMGNGLICCHTTNRKNKPLDSIPAQVYQYAGLVHISA